MKEIPAAKFKTHCLAVMNEVQATGEPVVITKDGRPLVKLVPAEVKNERSWAIWLGRRRSLGTSFRR